MNPETRAVACPTCHAQPGHGCRSLSRRRSVRPHLARVEAHRLNLTPPRTPDDRPQNVPQLRQVPAPRGRPGRRLARRRVLPRRPRHVVRRQPRRDRRSEGGLPGLPRPQRMPRLREDTPPLRRPVDRDRRKAPPKPVSERPPCGTEQGYQSHRWHKTTQCEPCKAAHAAAQAEYMRAKRYEGVLAARAVLAEVAADMRTTA